MTAGLPLLPELFESRIFTEEVDLLTTDLLPLLPEELAATTRASAARLLEYRGGRHCARRALGRFGVSGVPILRGEDRAPIWPSGFIGTISHTRNPERAFCGAAVASQSEVRAVGLDVELDEPLERKLWPRVLTPTERALIEACPESERGFWGKLVFSAKECVYKCQYPLSRQFLEFADVEVTLTAARSELSAVLARDAGPFRAGAVFQVRFVRRDGIIATGTSVIAGAEHAAIVI